MKRIAAVLLLLFCVCVPGVSAQTDRDTLYHQQLQASGAEELPRALPTDVQALLDSLELDPLDPDTYTDLSVEQMADWLWSLLQQQSTGPLQAVGMLMGVVMISALLGGIGGVGSSLPLRSTYRAAAVLGAGSVLLTPLLALLDTMGETVERVTVFLTAYTPVYAAVMAVGGRGVGALSYQTTLLGVIQLLGWLIRSVVYPVLTVSLAFGCTGAVAEGFCLDRLSTALHKTVLWALGLFSALFSGLLSIQQMVAAAGDSVGVRVARFTLSGFVPVVGGLLSEAYTTVMGCAGLLHTVIGAFGMVAVVLILVPPLVSCICWNVALHLASAAAGLFGLSPIEKLCTVSAGTVRVFIALLAVFGLLMVLATATVSSVTGG